MLIKRIILLIKYNYRKINYANGGEELIMLTREREIDYANDGEKLKK